MGEKSRKFSDCIGEKKDLLLAKESFCILITKNQYQELEEILELLGEKNQGSLCLVTLYPEMELKIKSRRNLKVLRWEVKR